MNWTVEHQQHELWHPSLGQSAANRARGRCANPKTRCSSARRCWSGCRRWDVLCGPKKSNSRTSRRTPCCVGVCVDGGFVQLHQGEEPSLQRTAAEESATEAPARAVSIGLPPRSAARSSKGPPDPPCLAISLTHSSNTNCHWQGLASHLDLKPLTRQVEQRWSRSSLGFALVCSSFSMHLAALFRKRQWSSEQLLVSSGFVPTSARISTAGVVSGSKAGSGSNVGSVRWLSKTFPAS